MTILQLNLEIPEKKILNTQFDQDQAEQDIHEFNSKIRDLYKQKEQLEEAAEGAGPGPYHSSFLSKNV